MTTVSLLDAFCAALCGGVGYLVMNSRSPAELGLDFTGLGSDSSDGRRVARGGQGGAGAADEGAFAGGAAVEERQSLVQGGPEDV